MGARVNRATLFGAFLLLCMLEVKAANHFSYEIIAKTGDSSLTGMGDGPSINDMGVVAFVGQLPGGEAVFVGDQQSPLTNITPSFVSSTRAFGRFVQINNFNKVVARDRLSGAPLRSLVRVWDVNSFAFSTIARGGGTSDIYDSVLAAPSLNNNETLLEDNAAAGGNNDGICDIAEACIPQVTFSAFIGVSNFLATPQKTPVSLSDSGLYSQILIDEATVRPMIADTGAIVARIGSVGDYVISLFNKTNDLAIANLAKGFTTVGLSPGISDDGRIVAFYGDLSASGAAALGTTSGPGIFAWIDRVCVSSGPDGVLDSAHGGDDIVTPLGVRSGANGVCETSAIEDDRQLVGVGQLSGRVIRVAGVSANGQLDPGELCLDLDANGRCDANEPDVGAIASFDQDSRVGVNSVGTVTYVAFDTSGNKTLFASQVELIVANPMSSEPASVASPPEAVIAAGSSVVGVGLVTNIGVYDPISDRVVTKDAQGKDDKRSLGGVAFWISTSAGMQAILRAHRLCPNDDYATLSSNPYINQYDAGPVLNLPISSATSGAIRGGNACGPSSMTMLINGYKVANAVPRRLNLFTSADYSTLTKVSAYGMTMKLAPMDNANNKFDWGRAQTYLKHLGYKGANQFSHATSVNPTVGQLKAYLDDNLAMGVPVLLSTTYSSKRRDHTNPYSDGHVILAVGRTSNGDYLVKDPAGDYFAGAANANQHYGLGKSCGGVVLYPQGSLKNNLAWRNSSGDLVAGNNAITQNLDDAYPRLALAVPADASADPAGLLVVGRFSGAGPRPYSIWLEDSTGRRSGWLANGARVQEIPESSAELNPDVPSDPDAPATDPVNFDAWPFGISILNPEAGLRVFVSGHQASNYSIEVVRYEEDGTMSTKLVSGSVGLGETKAVSISAAPHLTGDLDGDGDVDQDDLNIILAARGLTVSIGDPRDLDGDLKVTALDARKLTTLCTRPRCATH